jgi:DNA-binding beta-propeller fold protein YncE
MPISFPQSSSLLLPLVACAACAPAAAPSPAPPPPTPTASASAAATLSAPAAESASVVATPTTPPAKPTPSPALLMLAKRDEMLSIVDPSTLEVVARVPVGHDPHEVVASPDGKVAYVSNYGGGRFNTIAVVDLTTQTARPAIDLGALRGPHGLDYARGKVWFTAEGAKMIGSYDPEKGAIDWALGTGQDRTHMILVEANQIITTNVGSGTISFLQKVDRPRPPPFGAGAGHPPHPPPGPPFVGPGGGPGGPGGGPGGPPGGNWEQTLVSVGAGTEGFDLAPSGNELWAADAEDGSIAIVDVTTKKLIRRLDAKLRGANRLKFTHDGKWVLVSSLRGGDLTVFDAAKRTEAKRIPIGHGAAGIVVQPDSARAYVACSPDGHVAVIDLQAMTVVGKIPAGNEPDGLAWVTPSARKSTTP